MQRLTRGEQCAMAMALRLPPLAALCVLLLSVSFVAAEPTETAASEKRRSPRELATEEIIEMADMWLYDFDEDDSARLSATEMEPLLQQLKAGHEGSSDAAALNVSTLIDMADGNGDGQLDRFELVDLLKRMKGFDGGHKSRAEASKPSGEQGDVGYGKSHAERVKSKAKKGKRRKARPKDET